MKKQSHFDRRSATYDHDKLHHHIVALLIGGVKIKPGFYVLDIATGTGHLAFKAAQQVGSTGKVIGIDLSQGMLAEARNKAVAAEQHNIEFVLADAEQAEFSHESFDCIFCSSAIVLMTDISRALRHWFNFLKPNGIIAFDTPAKPFGLSQRVVEVAAQHGIRLAYADIADTPDKCRSFLKGAGFEVVDVRTELVNHSPVDLYQAIEFWDQRIDHPAWKALSQAPTRRHNAMRAEYMDKVLEESDSGYVTNDTALNFAYGRKPENQI